MDAHGAGGNVDGAGRRQKRTIRLRRQVAVSAFDIAFGKSVSGGSMQAHGVRRRGHAPVDYPRRAGEDQYLIGGRVAGMGAPGFALSVDVGDVSLLHKGLDAAARLEGSVQDSTGADAVGLPRILAYDAGIGCTVK